MKNVRNFELHMLIKYKHRCHLPLRLKEPLVDPKNHDKLKYNHSQIREDEAMDGN